jgi:hypothetical protein
MEHRPGLSDPETARFAWARFRRILWYMNLVSVACGLGAVAILIWSSGGVPWVFALLTFAGIYLTILLAAALMGLMFLSNGTGHDEQVIDPLEGLYPDD